jgi:hypothetical protein
MLSRSDFAEAITLFQYSSTALRTRHSRGIVRALRQLFASDEIGSYRNSDDDDPRTEEHDDPPRYGRYWRRRDYDDLQVNLSTYRRVPEGDRLPYLSLILVHEGSHAADTLHGLDSEYLARETSVAYYRELSTVGVFNEYADGPTPIEGRRRGIIQITARGYFERYRKMDEAMAENQLIDYILQASESYREEATFDWIEENIDEWGGLDNRTPFSLGVYLRNIAEASGNNRRRAELILDIMGVIDQVTDWTEMLDTADNLDEIRDTLGLVARHPGLRARIQHLQHRWRTQLLPPENGRR